jgi:hypothetical protein
MAAIIFNEEFICQNSRYTWTLYVNVPKFMYEFINAVDYIIGAIRFFFIRLTGVLLVPHNMKIICILPITIISSSFPAGLFTNANNINSGKKALDG